MRESLRQQALNLQTVVTYRGSECKLPGLLFAWLRLRAAAAGEVVRQVTNLMRPEARNGFNFHQQQTKAGSTNTEYMEVCQVLGYHILFGA